jgi:hypothetical protein
VQRGLVDLEARNRSLGGRGGLPGPAGEFGASPGNGGGKLAALIFERTGASAWPGRCRPAATADGWAFQIGVRLSSTWSTAARRRCA